MEAHHERPVGPSQTNPRPLRPISLEIAKGELLFPPAYPYVVPDLSKKPWAIQEPPHISALDAWQKLQKSHKRPGCQALSINQWILYNLRYILDGDLAGAWAPLGGLSSQFNHVGIVLDLAVTAHAGVSLAYDLQVGNMAKQMAETDREKNKVEGLLSELNQEIENNCMREFGIIPTYTPHKTKNKGDKDKGKGDKTPKGERKKTTCALANSATTVGRPTRGANGTNNPRPGRTTGRTTGPKTPTRPTTQPRPSKKPRPLRRPR